MLELQPEVAMARKSRLTRVAVKIGTAMGRADRQGWRSGQKRTRRHFEAGRRAQAPIAENHQAPQARPCVDYWLTNQTRSKGPPVQTVKPGRSPPFYTFPKSAAVIFSPRSHDRK